MPNQGLANGAYPTATQAPLPAHRAPRDPRAARGPRLVAGSERASAPRHSADRRVLVQASGRRRTGFAHCAPRARQPVSPVHPIPRPSTESALPLDGLTPHRTRPRPCRSPPPRSSARFTTTSAGLTPTGRMRGLAGVPRTRSTSAECLLRENRASNRGLDGRVDRRARSRRRSFAVSPK